MVKSRSPVEDFMPSSFRKGFQFASDLSLLQGLSYVIHDPNLEHLNHYIRPERIRSDMRDFSSVMNNLVKGLEEGLSQPIQTDAEQILVNIHKAIDNSNVQELQENLSRLNTIVSRKWNKVCD